MTASSPFAPPGRNAFLTSSPSSSRPLSTWTKNMTSVGILLLVIKFWSNSPSIRQSAATWVKERPWLAKWVNMIRRGILGSSTDDNSNRSTKRGPVDTISVPEDITGSIQGIKQIQENQQLISSVLKYWFGQFSPDGSQKHLWMIAASSVKRRKQVDQEISERFENLLLELGSPETFGRWSEWCQDENQIYGCSGKIAAIIVLDQFSRHIHRHHLESGTPTNILTQKSLDSVALRTAELMAEVHKQEISCGMIPLPMYIFALMPFRHKSTISSVEHVQECVENSASMNQQMESMLARFRKATNRRMAVLQDEARRTGGKSQGGTKDQTTDQTFTDEDILETFAFDCDLQPAVDHPVTKTIANFLNEQGILPGKEKDNSNSTATTVIVSLSGGVDSMVIASVLKNLVDRCGYKLNIIAVHIDYANRPESGAEADFVRRYCEKLGVDFNCRRINEVTRGITARDDYERIAREMRYDSYREAIAKGAKDTGNNNGIVGVMLGHHRGDLRENVLSNAHKGCGPLDLSGMTAVSKNDGVTLYRPLLPLEKTFILDYSHKFGVPYFKDTTPHWSTRGKLRIKLLPLLEEIYGEGSMNNLSNLAIESDECRDLLYESMIGPFLDAVKRVPMGIILDTAPWKSQPVFFWKFVLRETLHSVGLGMFSDKSTISFLERVQVEKPRSAWLQCRKDYAVYLQNDGKVFIFYPTAFPWRKSDMYNVKGKEVPYGEESIKVGRWEVSTEVVGDIQSTVDATKLLEEKAVPSMDALMNGLVEYYLEVPGTSSNGQSTPQPTPLKFGDFTKSSRPSAWKKTDLKLQSTLPVLAVDHSAEKEVSGKDDDSQTTSFLVKVRLKLT